MSIRVVTPPDPIVDPSDLSGSYDNADPRALAAIAAVTETIDGPTGWLGRALGPQTLLQTANCWRDCRFRLPCPPIIGIDSVTYIDQDGATQMVDAVNYAASDSLLWFKPGFAFPSLGCAPDPIQVQYRAGYNGTSGAAVGDAQTGDVPARTRQAIILTAQHMLNTAAENLFLSVDEVEGVGRQQYIVSDVARATIETTCDRLLAGLRIYSI